MKKDFIYDKIYTDGGCRGNGVKKNPIAGIGCVIIGESIDFIENCKKDISYYETLYLEENTNNKAELIAAIKGLKLSIRKNNSLLSEENPNLKIDLFSDSAYVVNGMNDWINGWLKNNWVNSKREPVKNKELWQTLHNISTGLRNKKIEVSFIKVKGHYGDSGNEKADALVNEAMNKPTEKVELEVLDERNIC